MSNDREHTWGALATAAWAVLILLISKSVEYFAFRKVFAETLLGSPYDDLNPATASSLASSAVVTAMTLFAISLRRGSDLKTYIACNSFPWRTTWPMFAIGIAVAAVTAWVRLEPSMEPTLMDQEALIVFALTLAFLVPASEEIFFRGFVITGFLNSRLLSPMAAPLSAALWASAHAEAHWYEYAALFAFGWMLGTMRIRSRSIFPGLLLHTLNNSTAIVLDIVASHSLTNNV